MAGRMFADRRDAGRVLAGLLGAYQRQPDVVVLGLPRGGVPVAYEIAEELSLPFDVFPVRKLGVPGRPEIAMGAIASGGVVVVNDDVVRALGLGPEVVAQVAQREGRQVLRHGQAYREGRAPLPVADKTVIIVDDGTATGAGLRAAVQALRAAGPKRIVVAVPAAPESTCRDLRAMAGEVVCGTTPLAFTAVGQSYWDFRETTDEEVRDLLRAGPRARANQAPTPVAAVRAEAVPLHDGVPPLDAWYDLVGDAHLVLIGEASHGTHECYAARAWLTRRLIEDKGFCAVAVEADWPDAYRVNRYVRGHLGDADAEQALRGFARFPTWMWRNTEVLDFVAWLRGHNSRVATDARGQIGFYGLDLYSLHRSIHEVITYLQRVDPAAAGRARIRYACFDHHHGGEGQEYGYAAAFGAGEVCEREVVEQLVDLQRNAPDYARRDGLLAEDELFHAERNAIAVRDAESYYRSMFSGREFSWNLRDRHMVDTLHALREHLGQQRGEVPRIVVWAHNSHVGDARAGETAARGELTVGQLVRERYPGDCRLIGVTTYLGSVTAADEWDAPARRMRVRPALPGSVEDLFHQTGQKGFLLRLGGAGPARAVLRGARLHRAIGVVYRPRTERHSHYLQTRLADQYDAVIHIDETRAVQPLERTAAWERGEAPETYPAGV